MKKIIFLVVFIATQITISAESYVNKVDSKNVKIDNAITLYTSIDNVKQKLGIPLKETTTYDEILEENLLTLEYKGMTLFFFNKQIFNFIITESGHSLYLNDYCIKVGMNSKLLENKFPKSYKNMENNIIVINVIEMDYSILQTTNKNGIITKINLFIPS